MSLVGKPGFRETSVGWIPEDWQPSTLGDAAHINPCRTKPESDEDEVSFLAMGDVSEDGRVITRQVRIYREVSKGFTSFIDDDVLVAKITPCFENGKGALVTNLIGGIGFGSTEFHVVRARPERAIPSFLNLHTRSDGFRRLGERNMVGSAGQKRVPTEFLREYPLALPPLPEQQKIAAILSAVDDKLDVIARQIEATQTLKRGLMQTLFSRGVGTQDADGRWVPHAELKDSELGAIPAGWDVKPLEALAHSITVGIATSTTEHYVQDGVPLIRNQNIKEDFLDMSDLLQISAEFDAKNKSKRVEGGDILTVRTGYPGVSCVVPDGLGRLQTFTTLITRPNRQLVNAHFVSRYFNSPQGKGLMLHQAAGGAQQNINAGNLKKLLVPVPSISEQERIAAVLAALDEKLRSLSSRSEHCQNLKRGLMQKLLTGEWRVSVDASAAGS